MELRENGGEHHAQSMKNDQEPGWMSVEDAASWSGLSITLIRELIADDLIVSSNVVKPGKTRGRRLVNRESLNAYIETGIGSKSELAMNAKRPTGGSTLLSHTYTGTAPVAKNPLRATPRELAAHLSISVMQVHRMMKAGTIPAVVREGRIYRFDIPAIDELLADRAANKSAS